MRAWLQLPQCTFEPQKHCFTSLCIRSILPNTKKWKLFSKLLTRTASVFYFQVLCISGTWIKKGVIGNHKGTVSSHLASLINLCTVMSCHVIWWQTWSIYRTSNVAGGIYFLVLTVEYFINIDKGVVWTGQVGCHEVARCWITFWKKK